MAAVTLQRVAESMAEFANNVRVNRDVALSVSRRISDLVGGVAAALEEDPHPEEWSEELKQFEAALDDGRDLVEQLARRSFLSQFLTRNRDAAKLTMAYLRVKTAFEALQAHTDIRRPLEAAALPELVYKS